MADYALVPLDPGIIRALQTIERVAVPEMPDRIIAASAKYLGLPLLSKDAVFTNLPGFVIVW
jgi:predicted nucleic acid-binding protein